MKIPILALFAFLLAPAPGFAASEAAVASKSAQNLNLQIREATAALGATRQCFDEEASLKTDLFKKKAALTAEFKGKIPPSFNDLLWKKTQRISKKHTECFRQYEELGSMLTAIHESFRTIEPKNLDVKKQKAETDALKEKYLLMMTTTKPNNKMPKPKSAAE